MKKFALAMSMSLLMSSVAMANPPFTVDTDETGAARKAPTFHRSLEKTFAADFNRALSQAQVWTKESPLRALYAKAIAENPPKKFTLLGLYEQAIADNTAEGVEATGILSASPEEWDAKLAEAYKDHADHLARIVEFTRDSKTKIAELEVEWNDKVAKVLSAPSGEWDAKLAEAYEGDEGAQAVTRRTTKGRFALAKSQTQWDTFLADLRKREPVSVSVVDETVKFEPVKALIQRALSSYSP